MNNQQQLKPQSTLLQTKIKILHGVILANEHLINKLNLQVSTLKHDLQHQRQKVKTLEKKLNMQSKFQKQQNLLTTQQNPLILKQNDQQSTNNNNQKVINETKCCQALQTKCCQALQTKIAQLQQQLIQTKLQLAQQFSDSLQQHKTIQSLKKQHSQLSDQLELISNKSETQSIADIKSQKNEGYEESDWDIFQNKQQYTTVTKQNLSDWINTQTQTYNQDQGQFIKTLTINNNTLQFNKLIKLWHKSIEKQQRNKQKLHIKNKKNLFNFSNQSTFSIFTKSPQNNSFATSTYPLLLKSHGVPIQLRTTVWLLIINDKLYLTQSLYQKLKQKSFQQHSVQLLIRQQIRKDMVRSFNGESSIKNLIKIYARSHGKTVKTTQQTPNLKKPEQQKLIQSPKKNSKKIQQQFSNDLSSPTTITSSQFTRKGTNQTNDTNAFSQLPILGITEPLEINFEEKQQQQIQQIPYPIQEIATRVLEIFSLYRPQISFVQGMTYPTIMLSLILSQQNIFKVLSNILLTRQFFTKMITVQQGFVDSICRVFDFMLLQKNEKLYNRLVRQLNIRSQVFVVDWFWTFYSRNLSPTTILKIWDLILYHFGIQSQHPQLVFFQLAMTVLEMLSPILYQTNYEQTIRTIREYWRKIDELQMIQKVYGAMQRWQNMEDQYKKACMKVGKRMVRVKG